MIDEWNRLVGKKAILFRFAYNNVVFLYCDGSRNVIYNGETYIPEIINADEIYKSNGEAFKNNINIEMTTDCDLVKLWQTPSTSPNRVIGFEVIEVLLSDTTKKHIWGNGQVMGLSTDNEKAMLTCADQSYSYGKSALRTGYNRTCPWSQYDQMCRLDINDWAHTTTIVSMDTTRTFIGVASLPIDVSKLGGGRVDTDFNTYVALSVNAGALIVEIDTPMQAITNVGDIIKIAPTCSYLQSNCKNVFNNKERFGGHIFITTSIFDPNQIELPK